MAETIKAEPVMDQLKQKQEALRARFVGKQLSEVPTPSVILDLRQVAVNCARMLEAADNLGLQWRAHIKTHKVKQVLNLHTKNVKMANNNERDIDH